MKDFINLIKEDNELSFVERYRDKDDVLEGIYDLSREIYLVHYSAKPIKLEKGYGYQIEEHEFKRLNNLIQSFIKELDSSNEKIIEEILEVIEKFYYYVPKSNEAKSRTFIEYPEDDRVGRLFGTLYNFDSVDWDYFKKGLKRNK